METFGTISANTNSTPNKNSRGRLKPATLVSDGLICRPLVNHMVYLILSPLLSLALLSGMTVPLANKNGNDKERYVILMWLCFLLAPSLGGLAAFLPRTTYFDFSLFIGITIASWPFGCLPASVTAVLAAALKLHRNPQGVVTMTFIGGVCGLLFGILNADIVGLPLSGTTLAGAIAAFAFSCLLPKERPSENERSEFLRS